MAMARTARALHYMEEDISLNNARVFPRRTKATPIDDMAFIGMPPRGIQADSAEVSVTFTWDKLRGEQLAEEWSNICPTKLGGVAYGEVEGEFEVGRFLQKGWVITSRGCPNHCWFCYAWRRVKFQELDIKDGWIVQDDNLLACSSQHILDVFSMLKRQPKKPIFNGGIEAKLLNEWNVNLIVNSKPERIFLAYDTEDDYEPLVVASKLLQRAEIIRPKGRIACCYCLIGYPKDTIEKAEFRLERILKLGFMPFAMLWKKENSSVLNEEWRRFQRLWARPAIIFSRYKNKYYV